MDLSTVLSQSDLLLKIVFFSLIAMSIATWYLIATKGYAAWKARRSGYHFQQRFWQCETLISAERLAVTQPDTPFARIALAGIQGLQHYRAHAPRSLGALPSADEFLIRSIRNAITAEQTRLEAGLTVLGSVGSTAPFVGLFGTVWGIYHAMIDISKLSSASLDVVAGPVGEALIATAAGLAAAIPAVLAYNAIVRQNRLVLADLDGFAHDLHAQLSLGSATNPAANGFKEAA